MTRYSKSNGKYSISGHSYPMLVGSRAQVWHGTAFKTSGGLTKSHLLKNKSGRVVSKSKHTASKREKRLLKHGYGTKKGHFGAVKMGTKSKSRKMRGGSPYGSNFSPSSFDGTDGQGVTNYGSNSNNVQFAAGMAGGKKSRKMRGGSPYGSNFSPSSFDGTDGQGVTNYGSNSNNVQFAAGMAGGKKSRKMRGGKGYGWLSGSGIAGQGLTNFGAGSNDVQFAAGMAGGKRRRRGKRGGTGKPMPVGMGNPLTSALGAS